MTSYSSFFDAPTSIQKNGKLDALQKGAKAQFFLEQVTFQKFGPKMQTSCQILVFMLVTLVS